jgi:capsular exopolysaccharide synthesis family protein
MSTNRQRGKSLTLDPKGEKDPSSQWLHGQYVDLYEDLKVNIFGRYGNSDVKVIMITGCSEGDGATVTAINFAAILGRTPSLKVLYLEANFRKPYFYQELIKQKSSPASGAIAKISTLVDLMAIDDSLLESANIGISTLALGGRECLSILPSGECYSNPVVIFESRKFDQIIAALRQHFDYIIIDAPPVLGYAEASLMSPMVDGVVMVVKSERTRLQVADRAKKQIIAAGGRLLGVVLNQRNHYIPPSIYKFI